MTNYLKTITRPRELEEKGKKANNHISQISESIH